MSSASPDVKSDPFEFFDSKEKLPYAEIEGKFMLTSKRLYGVSVHFSEKSAEQFPNQEMPGCGVLLRSYFKGTDGKLRKNKGFTKEEGDTPEVGLYLRWEEFETLVRMYKVLKKEGKKLRKQKKEKKVEEKKERKSDSIFKKKKRVQ